MINKKTTTDSSTKNIFSTTRLMKIVLFNFLIISSQSCLLFQARDQGGRSNNLATSNNPSTLTIGTARVLKTNPIAQSEDFELSPDINIANYLDRDAEMITLNDRLFQSCEGNDGDGDIMTCFEVREEANAVAIENNQDTWGYEPDTSEWLQVQNFYHMDQMITRYMNVLRDMYNSDAQPLVFPSLLGYTSSLPIDLYTTYANWYGNETMLSYADCGEEDNAYFLPSSFSMCFGNLSQYPDIYMVEDPSVIYHELGHALSQVMINIRGVAHGIESKADISYASYDESGSIQEGLADYFSYIMNGRSKFGEWGLGRFLAASRPLTEDDDLHSPGISTEPEFRLKYPDYLSYEPNEPELTIEDVHNAGMVASHFLTTLHRDFEEECNMEFEEAGDLMLYLLIETYAQLGDLSSTSNDHSDGSYQETRPSVNHVSTADDYSVRISEDWVKKVHPINYRSFFQTFSKFVYQIMANEETARCDGDVYPLDNLEKILDSYGLLLFDSYNENGNSSDYSFSQSDFYGHTGDNKTVNSLNRQYSVMIDKDLIDFDPDPTASTFFVFDKRSDMLNALEGLKYSGNITEISANIPDELDYNNGNGQISPGELVGVAINLYNNSNSTMGGVQILANDWDHTKGITTPKPCNTFEDEFPSLNEGAASEDSDPDNPEDGDCNYVTRTNGLGTTDSYTENEEALHPVCFVQVEEDGASKWVSQSVLMDNEQIEKSQCLGGEDGSSHDCFIRAVRGGDFAWYSKINPKANWGESVPTSSGSPKFTEANVLFFEVNKKIPPGTTFDCRFRVRFTNCKNCWIDPDNENGDDYVDHEYSGADPFKILHFSFTVID